MTRDQIVSIIKQRMGNNTDPTLDALIVTEMQLQQGILEEEPEKPWFLVTTGSAAGTADSRVVGPPTKDRSGTTCALLGEYEPGTAWVKLDSDGTDEQEICDKEDYAIVYNSRNTVELTRNSHPKFYTQDPDTINVYQVWSAPTENYTFYLQGYYADVPLTSDITNLWLTHAPDLIIGRVGSIMAGQYEALSEFAAAFLAQETQARNRLMKMNVLKEEENIRRVMGDS